MASLLIAVIFPTVQVRQPVLNEIPKVEINDKLNLTIEEAAAYSNIGINCIDKIAKRPNCPFVLYVGRKKLIKRKEFDKYIEKVIEL